MKAYMKVFAAVIVCVSALSWSNVYAVDGKTDWNAFSKNLVKAMASENVGLQMSAMQQIITYAENLDVSDAVFDVVSVYRNHKNEQVRKLALTTLYKMNNGWAIDFLAREVRFEKSPQLKKQIYQILCECDHRYARAESKKDIILAEK